MLQTQTQRQETKYKNKLECCIENCSNAVLTKIRVLIHPFVSLAYCVKIAGILKFKTNGVDRNAFCHGQAGCIIVNASCHFTLTNSPPQIFVNSIWVKG